MGADMTLGEFLGSKWFSLLWKGAAIMGGALSAYIGVSVYGMQSRQAGFETSLTTISSTQSDRAADNERFQTSVTTELGHVSEKVSSVKEDVALIRGIVQEMQRRDVAQSALRIVPR